jgi:hypothetical protein
VQDAGLGLAERLAQAERFARWCGGAARPRRARPGELVEDLPDQGGVPGPLLGVALEQSRRGVEQERDERAVGFGGIEGVLEGAPGGVRVAECVAGDRLQQECLHHPQRGECGDRTVQDRRERGRRRLRVVPGEPQCRQGDAHLRALALFLVQPGDGGLDAFSLAQPQER